jgi:tRNA threonylcarbamoyladenosine biosynthesis protein TsaB
MIVLTLDTTTRAGGAAVLEDGRLLATVEGQSRRTQGERLPGDLLDVLARAGRPLVAVDLFAVASGPGSFTGLRVGIATMQGLAFARGRPVAPISALDALASLAVTAIRASHSSGEWLAAIMDAHRHEAFAQVWSVDRSGGEGPVLAELHAPVVMPAADLSATLPATPGWIIGDSALVAPHAGVECLAAPANLAPAIAALAYQRGPSASCAPHAVKPLYIRRPDAELARDRQIDRQLPK